MWSSRLFWKLFLTYAGLNLAWVVVFAVIVSTWHERQVARHEHKRLSDVAILVQSYVTERFGGGRSASLQTWVQQMEKRTGLRITLVTMDGQVLADSERTSLAEVALMENHKNRPELVQAARTGVGRSSRPSPTLGLPMDYLALRTDKDGSPVGLVRVALPTASIRLEMAEIHRLIWLLAALVSVSVIVLTSLIATRIIWPINRLKAAAQSVAEGDYDQRVKLRQRDELSQLADAFTEMSQQLATQMSQLRTGGERLATVLGRMDEGVIAVDGKLEVLFANTAAGKMFDFAAENAERCRLLELVRHPILHDVVADTLRKTESHESEMQPGGSGDRTLSVHSTPLPGKPCPGVVLVLRDVTELRRLESVRRDFVANVSHELKTPLSSIKAYAETLSEGAIEDSEHRLQFVHQIEEQAERLHQLIVDVLSLARIESGTETFDIQPVTLPDAVRSCYAHHRTAAESRQIALNTQPSDPAVRVLADEEGVRQILDNLVDNAIKYTPPGGQVAIGWRVSDSVAVIQVRDTGIGIAAKDLPRVFERFFRVDVARSRQLGGTGLGLSIVKHLTQFFGGTVDVASEPGVGSTFEVRLPLG